MTTPNIDRSSKAFFDKYKPQHNAQANRGWRIKGTNYLFGLHGAEIDKVMEADQRHVWTLLGAGSTRYIVAGYHYVNRIGYFITDHPFDDKNESFKDTIYNDNGS